MKRFFGNPRSAALVILLVVLLWGTGSVAPGAELDSVIVVSIDPEAGDILLVKRGISKWTIPLKVGPHIPVTDSLGQPLALTDIRVGAEGTIRYTRSPSGDYTVETLVLD